MNEIGMIVLYEGEEPISADVILVHGLRGNRIKTWEVEQVVWPRDLLREDLKHVRVLTWGYNTEVVGFFESAGQSSIHAHASQLLEDIAGERTDSEQKRPIIFVAHSLGGLVVKDALAKSAAEASSTPVHQPRIARIKRCTIGIVFAGTPHRGSDQARWARIATNLAGTILKDNNSRVVNALCRGSETLERLQADFSRFGMTLRITTFFEDYRMAGIGKVVDDDSASLGFPNESRQTIPADHSLMVKFKSRGDAGYKRIKNAISNMIEDGIMQPMPQSDEEETKDIILRCTKNYSNQNGSFLSFVKDDIIVRFRFLPGEYWEGQLHRTRQYGLFPRDHVDTIPRRSPRSFPNISVNRESWKPDTSTAAIHSILIQATPIPASASLPANKSVSYDHVEAFLINAEEGDFDKVQRYLSMGVDPNVRGGDFGTALVAAAANGHYKIVHLLLENGAEVNALGGKDGCALHTAAVRGQDRIVRILLAKGANVQLSAGQFRLPLTAAAAGGNIRILRILLENGAELNAKDTENETALHGAVWGRSIECVEFLLERGIAKDVKGNQGTALELAQQIENQSPGQWRNIIRLLSDGDGSEPTDFVEGVQDSPLADNPNPEPLDPGLEAFLKYLRILGLGFSARDGDFEAVLMLLRQPDPVSPNELFDEYHGFPLNAAAANNHLTVVQLLLEQGASVVACGGKFGFALHYAACFGHSAIVQLLLAWGAPINQPNRAGQTAIYCAAAMGHIEVMHLLIARGADFQWDFGAGTPLHAAASHGYLATEYLLIKGAHPGAITREGFSTADIARACNNHQTKDLLKRWGSPRSHKLSIQRFLAWSSGVLQAQEQAQQVQRQAAMDNVIRQYGAALSQQESQNQIPQPANTPPDCHTQ